ncbi:MAG: DUF4157 domain-containing protein [Acidobacteriota bacterium]|nr:DUF4157 domain-containing protein [Acidobacteriota bacterium]
MAGAVGGSDGPAGHAPLRRGRHPVPAVTKTDGSSKSGDVDSLEWQKRFGNAAVGSVLGPSRGDLVRRVVGSPGRPMEADARKLVEETTGADASGIRVHDGPKAARAADAVNAEMFASGDHLVAPKGLDVTTREGAFKTIHEVHHIVNQQRKGPVEGTETGDGLKISDPGDRHEQEANRVAARAVSHHFGT